MVFNVVMVVVVVLFGFVILDCRIVGCLFFVNNLVELVNVVIVSWLVWLCGIFSVMVVLIMVFVIKKMYVGFDFDMVVVVLCSFLGIVMMIFIDLSRLFIFLVVFLELGVEFIMNVFLFI